MTKQCDELRDLLSGYRDGELSAEDAYRVAGHLAECLECATALTSDNEIEEVVSESIVPRTSVEWDALTMGIQRALEDEANRRQQAVERLEAREKQRRRWRRFLLGLTPRRLAFGGAGTIAIAALVFLLQPWQQELSPESKAPPVGLASEAAPREELRALGSVDEVAMSESRESLGSLGSLEGRPTEPDAQLAEEEPTVVARDSRGVAKQGKTESDALAKEKLSQPAAPEAKKTERVDAKPSVGRVAAPAKRSRTGSTGFVARDIEPEPVAIEMTEPVRVSVTAPPADSPERQLKTDGPAFAPAPPPGGARSVDEVRFWLGAPAGGAGARVSADADETAPAAGGTVERALSRANALISQGERDRGRAGLVLLTGDFDGNVARERAWTRLLSLDTDTAFRTRKPDVILPIALSMDAFLEAYPEHENAESIREQQVRVWARLATADETYCAAALVRAKAWEASLGPWVPFETRMVVARMRNGPCSE